MIAKHSTSAGDDAFIVDLESGNLAPAQFDHRAHVRAAYIYLVSESSPDAAAARMRDVLRAYLLHHAIDASKYHETITRAWILAVRHFMTIGAPASSADEFIDANPRLLDGRIMLTHYSADLLFSPQARATFIEPDISPIPEHGSE